MKRRTKMYVGLFFLATFMGAAGLTLPGTFGATTKYVPTPVGLWPGLNGHEVS
jgi:hypothetical protein